MAEIGGELAEMLKQVGWHLGDVFKDDMRKAIQRFGQEQYSEGAMDERVDSDW